MRLVLQNEALESHKTKIMSNQMGNQQEDEFKPKKKDFFFYLMILAGLCLITGYIMTHYSNYERVGDLAMVSSMLVISIGNLYNYFDSRRKDIIAGVLGIGTLLLALNIIFNG